MPGEVQFVFLDEDGAGITLDDLRSRLSKLDNDTIVYYGDFFRDKNGFLDQETVIPILSKESRRPIYSPYSFIFGLGTVGGKLNSALFQGEAAAQMAMQILNGTSPSKIPVMKESINHYVFDFRQMERWNIREDNLPAGSIVMYKRISFFEEYRLLVIVALIVFTILLSVNAALVLSIRRRKQAESSLRTSERRYRTLTEQMPDMTWQKDIHGVYVSCNSNYADVLGVTLETIAGHRDEDFYKPELVEKYLADDQSVITTGEPLETEERWEEAEEARWLHTSKVPLRDEDGAVIGTIGLARDITERKKSEEALRGSEEQYRRLFETMAQGVVYQAAGGKIISANPAATKILGLSLDQMMGKTSLDPDWKAIREDGSDLPGQEHPAMVSLRTGKPVEDFVMGVINPQKDMHSWISVTATPLFKTGETTPFQVYATFDDITTERRDEEMLRKNAEQHKAILRTAMDGIWRVDIQGRLLEVNESYCRMSGYSEPELLAMHIADLEIAESAEVTLSHMQKVMAHGEDRFETRHHRKDGSIFDIEVSVQFRPADGGQFVAFLRDITERKRAEEEKASLEAQLRQAQKMDAIGTLAGGVAHDFNNILGAIIGYTEMAMDEDQKKIRGRYLQETLKGAERAKDVVRQILTFSRQESHEKKPLNIKLLLKESIRFLRASIPATIEIQQHLTDKMCNIMADPTQMHQVIMNLCTNATHAMKQAGGVLTVELSQIELSKAEIPRYPDLKPGPYVRLTVSDTGHGIDLTHIQRIFDPFFTTKPMGEGTGLGLSVVYGIIKSHDGAIHVYSETGKGASFSVYLPKIIHENSSSEIVASPASKGTERILFVDDEPALVDIGISMLSALGYEVTGVTSSMEGLDLFRAEPDRFDLVITDMTLPKMTGIDLSRKIMQIRPDTPIILCSGIREPETEELVKSLGIRAYCIKPLTRKVLSQVIRDTLDGDGI
ncbi:MAG: PAS domain S-box protein [Syntrophales bacterium]